MSLFSSIFNQLSGCFRSLRWYFYSPTQAMTGLSNRIDASINKQREEAKRAGAEVLGIEQAIQKNENDLASSTEQARKYRDEGSRELALAYANKAVTLQESIDLLKDSKEQANSLYENLKRDIISLKSQKVLIESKKSSVNVRRNTAMRALTSDSANSLRSTRASNKQLMREVDDHIRGLENRAASAIKLDKDTAHQVYDQDALEHIESNKKAEDLLDRL